MKGLYSLGLAEREGFINQGKVWASLGKTILNRKCSERIFSKMGLNT